MQPVVGNIASQVLGFYVLPNTQAVAESGESSGRKWATGHRVRKGEGKLGVLRAPFPLLAQEDPQNEVISLSGIHLIYTQWYSSHIYSVVFIWGVECTLAVIGTGGPVKRSDVI